MYTVLRRYADRAVLDAVAAHQAEIEALMRGVPGFRSYQALRIGAGGVTITTCDDQAGTTASSRGAADWVRQNAAGAAGAAPEITEGEVFIHF